MRSFDEIAVTTDAILSLNIEGMPTSDRALRAHASRNGWPMVFNEKGRALFLVDAIPDPFGPEVRAGLAGMPLCAAPPPCELMECHPLPLVEMRDCRDEILEARLLIIFEVFRWAAYVGETEAVRGVSAFSKHRRLSPGVQSAADRATANGERGGVSYSTLRRWLTNFKRSGIHTLRPSHGAGLR